MSGRRRVAAGQTSAGYHVRRAKAAKVLVREAPERTRLQLGADDGDASVQSKSSRSAMEATAIDGLLSAKAQEPRGLSIPDLHLLGEDESSQPGQW